MKLLILSALIVSYALPADARWRTEERDGRLLKPSAHQSITTFSGGISICCGRKVASKIPPGKSCHWEKSKNGFYTGVENCETGVLEWVGPPEKLVLDVSTSWEDHLEKVLFDDSYKGAIYD